MQPRERTPKQIQQVLLAAVIALSLLSLAVTLARQPDPREALLLWLEGWSQAMLAGLLGALVVFYLLEGRPRESQPPTLPITPPPPEEITRPVQPLLPTRSPELESFVTQLKAAPDKAARQAILNEMKNRGLLAGANLSNLDLQGANLYDANLRGALLEGCNLESAYLIEADLRGANLSEANLQKAELSWADLEGAFLGLAKLQGAWLLRANLKGVFLKNAHFDTATRLPDGEIWKPGQEMERFTEEKHAHFWRPEPGFFGELPRWYRRNGA